uniref:BPTI/Kunitz inhibitor domain-containing protein n=1 Tax=Panagrellus redivivus TaxID=6233 RepID=A0A7E4W440_PANRE
MGRTVLLLSVLIAVAACLETVPVSDSNPLLTEWSGEDESAMRDRMEQYAKEKFAHHYHFFANISENATKKVPKRVEIQRRRREAITGSIATAVVTGMIGMTARAVSDLTTFHPMSSNGGCKWFGTAPFCNFPCPSEYDYIRPHNGRCSKFWFSGLCNPDPSFGEPCSTILGGYFTKRFCCKSDPNDCTWSGRWMGANTAYNSYCRYDNSVGLCGELSCSINHFSMKAQAVSSIGGERCDEIQMFNATGRATCGYIAWYDDEDKLINSWYKTS